MWLEGYGDLPGQLVVVSGPSGSGKSTLVRRVLGRPELPARLSVSATTRRPREGEQEGIDYYYYPQWQFQHLISQGRFLEHAEYTGNYYGTPLDPVIEQLKQGVCLILEIEVNGALQVRRRAPTSLFVFVKPPRFQDLSHRLRDRGTEDSETIHRRLVRAREELSEAQWYDEQIINGDLDAAVEQLANTLSEHLRGG